MKKKVLFIDRDGTIIVEPKTDFQIDSLEDLEFLPKAISQLRRIATELDYELVLVTNQDGLGTEIFPEENFWPAHEKMLKTLEGEGIRFAHIYIDRSFEHENLPTRKPGTGMLTRFFSPEYDLAASFVIGDRNTDLEMALSLGSGGIYMGDVPAIHPASLISQDWEDVYRFLASLGRSAKVERRTLETDITVTVDLDGSGHSLHTGIGFFDHMLEQIARHAGIGLQVHVQGDLHVDEHHSIEDVGLALGSAFAKALGDKRGIGRYGFFLLPMDEALAQVALDFSGRPYLVWQADFRRERVGGMPTEMFQHFFKSFSDMAGCNLNVRVEGDNDHHKIEAIFKAFAKSLKMAIAHTGGNQIPSTKGSL